MGPVAYEEAAVLAHNHVGGVKVAVADGAAVAKAVGAHLEVIAGRGVERLHAADHTHNLVALAGKRSGGLGVLDLDLQVDKGLEKLIELVRSLGLLHEVVQGAAGEVLVRKGPGAVLDLRDLEHLGGVEPLGLLDAGEVQRLAEDVDGGLGAHKGLYDPVAVLVDDLVVAACELDALVRKLHGDAS